MTPTSLIFMKHRHAEDTVRNRRARRQRRQMDRVLDVGLVRSVTSAIWNACFVLAARQRQLGGGCGPPRRAPPRKAGRRIVHCRGAKPVALGEIKCPEFGLADACSVLKHGRKHLPKIAGRACITCNTSDVAVCCSNDWRWCAVSSLSSRAFSIAMTACAAKFSTSAICSFEKGRAAERVKARTPTATPSRSIGTPSTVRKPPNRCPSFQVKSGSARTSAMWITLPSSRARPVPVSRPGSTGISLT